MDKGWSRILLFSVFVACLGCTASAHAQLSVPSANEATVKGGSPVKFSATFPIQDANGEPLAPGSFTAKLVDANGDIIGKFGFEGSGTNGKYTFVNVANPVSYPTPPAGGSRYMLEVSVMYYKATQATLMTIGINVEN